MDEQRVIAGCLKGDTNAYRDIYQEYGQQLLRTAMGILKNRQDAEDSVQITFMKLYKSIGKFRKESRLKTYIFRILINSCFDISRKNSTINTLQEDEKQVFTNHNFELDYSLEQAIELLPKRMKICFILFAVEGFRQSEISEMMDISIGSVKSMVFNAKAHLRKILSSEKEA